MPSTVFVSAVPVQLIFISAGPVQLIFISAGPAQLIFAGPAQLVFVSTCSALPVRPLVPLGLLVDYEGMVWCPAPEPAPHQRPPVPAPRQRPLVPAPRQRPLVPAPRHRPPVPAPHKCSQVLPLVLPSSSSSPLVPEIKCPIMLHDTSLKYYPCT